MSHPPRKEAVRRSGLFDAAWYLERHPDVRMLGIDPLEHYLRFGAAMGRSPGPRFNAPGYLAMHPDVARANADPLLHYIRHGIREGRLPGFDPAADPAKAKARLRQRAAARADGEPQRFLGGFDRRIQCAFIADVQAVHSVDWEAINGTRASIVMPVYNRSRQLPAAIGSVLEQEHANWELLIVDDGSREDPAAGIGHLLRDPRIRLLRQPHRGVSAARNAGLAHASGDVVFYLDSDNRWTPPYLRTMLGYLHATGSECGYAALAVEDAAGRIEGYRGEPFDWRHCLAGNYVDLNVFAHSIALYRRLGGFDETLRRMVDWDLILKYTRGSMPAHAPFIGCHYSNRGDDPDRISSSRPYAYREIVQLKHRLDAASPAAIAAALQLRIAIKIAAPRDRRDEWGDFHYADSLAAALRALGHRVDIHFREDWYRHKPHQHHVAIVLRGLLRYRPDREQVNVLWNISHPDQVEYAEYDDYDIAYVASPSYPALLEHIVRRPVRTLLQCTDAARFPFTAAAGEPGEEVLFVGNSRNHFRPAVRWAQAAGAPLRVYGTRWEQFIDPRHVAGSHVPNAELAGHYAGAGVVLNDHWESMRDFGLVSNRVFDVLACGGRLVSDTVPSIDRLFGDAVAQFDSPASLADAIARVRDRPRTMEQARATSDLVRTQHSFEARAARIRDDVFAHLGLPAPAAAADIPPAAPPAAPPRDGRIRVGLLLQRAGHGPTSSAFIRLLAPLTTEFAHGSVEPVLLDGVDDPRLDACTRCIVQRVAVPSMEEARSLLERLAGRGTPLFVDNDDAFGLLDADHPEFAAYHGKHAALLHLMRHASQVWFSTTRLRDLYRKAGIDGTVLGNHLDPRLWRDYRKPPREIDGGLPLQLLYMGTKSHDRDFAMILPALDALAARRPGSFELSLVGAVRDAPTRDWLRVTGVPAKTSSYPHFVRWLGRQGPYDLGLAPLVDSGFNACKSDVKILDYAALGIASLVSDVAAYRGEAGDQAFVTRIANSDDPWLAALTRLVDAPADLRERGQAAQAWLWRQRGVDSASRRLLSALA